MQPFWRCRPGSFRLVYMAGRIVAWTVTTPPRGGLAISISVSPDTKFDFSLYTHYASGMRIIGALQYHITEDLVGRPPPFPGPS